MSKQRVVEIECDVCHNKTQAKSIRKIPKGWTYVTIGSVNNVRDTIAIHLCIKHSHKVLTNLK